MGFRAGQFSRSDEETPPEYAKCLRLVVDLHNRRAAQEAPTAGFVSGLLAGESRAPNLVPIKAAKFSRWSTSPVASLSVFRNVSLPFTYAWLSDSDETGAHGWVRFMRRQIEAQELANRS